MEQWVNIDERIAVSSLGNIKSMNYKNSGRQQILKPAKDKKGYLRTMLKFGDDYKTIKVHRLIAQTFIPNPLNLLQVNHINGIKTDNRVENLEWCDNRTNIVHAYENALIKTKSV